MTRCMEYDMITAYYFMQEGMQCFVEKQSRQWKMTM